MARPGHGRRVAAALASRHGAPSRAAAVVLAVVAPLLAPGQAEAGVAPPEQPWDKSPVSGYSGGQNYLLQGVTVPEAGDVWAVGYKYGYVGGATEFRTVIMRGTAGGTFTVVPSPDREGAPATNFLEDVSGPSSDDLWAVGHSRNPRQPSRTLIEHWNGTAWTIWSSPDPGPSGNILTGVTTVSANDVWAVGARQDSFYQSPMAQHWNGSTWSTVTVPNPAFCTGHSYLSDVAALSATNVVATGICTSSTSGGDQGYVVRWNGTRWRAHPASSAVPTRGALNSVSTYNGQVWLVGDSPAGGFAMTKTSAGWSQVPIDGSGRTMAGVVAVPGRKAWAVGTGPSPQPPFAGPGSLQMTAKGGVPQPAPVDFGRLYDVAYDPAGRIWAVGFALPGGNNVPLVVSRPAR